MLAEKIFSYLKIVVADEKYSQNEIDFCGFYSGGFRKLK